MAQDAERFHGETPLSRCAMCLGAPLGGIRPPLGFWTTIHRKRRDKNVFGRSKQHVPAEILAPEEVRKKHENDEMNCRSLQFNGKLEVKHG